MQSSALKTDAIQYSEERTVLLVRCNTGYVKRVFSFISLLSLLPHIPLNTPHHLSFPPPYKRQPDDLKPNCSISIWGEIKISIYIVMYKIIGLFII